MRAMIWLALGRCTSSRARECATTAMSAAMPHSSALSARGAACGAAALVVEAAHLAARDLAVVVRVQLGEAALQLGRVARLVAGDEAVPVLVEAVEERRRAGRAPARGRTGGLLAPGLVVVGGRRERQGKTSRDGRCDQGLPVHRLLHGKLVRNGPCKLRAVVRAARVRCAP